jgi:hypothetical protein
VTLLAAGREIGLYVIRIRGAVVIVLMAGDTCGICAGEVVIVVDVTLSAGQRSVRSCQRKTSIVVVKGCIRPCNGVVALLTARWEIQLDVIRICRVVVVSLMTTRARSVCPGQVVIAVDMALRALQCVMRTREWESGRGVIEGCVRP